MRCASSRLLAAALCLACASAFALDLQGHRGTRGNAPENTLAAFSRALAIGVDTLELDVGLTADGVVVVSHNAALDPVITRDASGQWLPPGRGPLIHSLTLAQLQAYDVGRIRPDTPYAKTFASQQGRDGEHVPTLAAVFDLVKSRGAPVRFNIETKIDPTRPADTASPEAMVQALLKVVQDAGMASRVSIQSFDWRTLRLVQKAAPAIPTVCLTVQSANSDNVHDTRWTAGLRIDEEGGLPALVKAAGCAAWSPNAGAVTQDLVKEAQSLGLQVIPWTVNAPADMDRLVGWNVDGLITDYPDRLRQVMQARGMAVPKPFP
ncbi:glycerophosphodiester phosphodiesterase [Ramlibacter sp. MMS24-I3-19]|uniref:glycerophosphodiester phosphodiesterase n=1 Tax=Ramlibacter sp. MMS24-I3-19 TaxID=3416606 RepID=UPI003CFD1B72